MDNATQPAYADGDEDGAEFAMLIREAGWQSVPAGRPRLYRAARDVIACYAIERSAASPDRAGRLVTAISVASVSRMRVPVERVADPDVPGCGNVFVSVEVDDHLVRAVFDTGAVR